MDSTYSGHPQSSQPQHSEVMQRDCLQSQSYPDNALHCSLGQSHPDRTLRCSPGDLQPEDISDNSRDDSERDLLRGKLPPCSDLQSLIRESIKEQDWTSWHNDLMPKTVWHSLTLRLGYSGSTCVWHDHQTLLAHTFFPCEVVLINALGSLGQDVSLADRLQHIIRCIILFHFIII